MMRFIKLILNLIISLIIFNIILFLIKSNIILFIFILLVLTIYHIKSLSRQKNFIIKKKIKKINHFTLIIINQNNKNKIDILNNIHNINYEFNKYNIIILDEPYDIANILINIVKNITYPTDIIGILNADSLVSENILNYLNVKFQNYYGGIQVQEWNYNLNSYFTKAQHFSVIHDNFKMLLEPYFKDGFFINYSLIKNINYKESSRLRLSELIINSKYNLEVISDVLIYPKLPESFKLFRKNKYKFLKDLNLINKKQFIQEDIILSFLIVFSIIAFFIDFNIFIVVFGYFNFLGILIIINAINFYYHDCNNSAINNSPKLIKNIIKKQNKIYFIDIINCNIIHLYLLILRLIIYIFN